MGNSWVAYSKINWFFYWQLLTSNIKWESVICNLDLIHNYYDKEHKNVKLITFELCDQKSKFYIPISFFKCYEKLRTVITQYV